MKSYGTTSTSHVDHLQVDAERAGASGSDTPSSIASKTETEDDMQPLLQGDYDSVISETSHETAQAGVKRAEAISSTWSKGSLYVAYVGLGLLSYATSLESQTTVNFAIYATSTFSAHALVSTVFVVQGVILSIAKPPMSKIADVFGRFEAFSLAVAFYIMGYILQAASTSVDIYATAQIFSSAGQTGLQILTQIFIADTSDLVNRAMCTAYPDIPYLINVFAGPALAGRILEDLNWRWGYGIWAVVLPVAFLPLAMALALSQRKAAKRGTLPKSQFAGKPWAEIFRMLWFELDFFGLVLICAAFALLLLPLTLAEEQGWGNSKVASMLLVGAICLCAIPFWERNKRLAPHPFFPRAFWRNKTILAGLGLAFFYFMAFYSSVYPYFQSYLLVVQGLNVTNAGQVVQTFTFTSTITALCVARVIQHKKRYKAIMVSGTLVYSLALLLMIWFRSQESPISVIVATQLLLGVGGSLIHTPAQVGVQASATHSEVAAITTLFLTFMEIGGAVGSAISGAIWTSNIPNKLNLYLPPESRDQAADIFANITLAANGWPMGSPERIAINRAYQETMTKILTGAFFVSIPCILLSLLMQNYKLDEVDQGIKGTVIGGTRERVDRADFDSPDESNVYINEEDDSLQRLESRTLLLRAEQR